MANKLINQLTGKEVAGWKNASGSPLVKMTNLVSGKYIEFEQPPLPKPTDLTGTKWKFNDDINFSTTVNVLIDFISNKTNYYALTFLDNLYLRYQGDSSLFVFAHDSQGNPIWEDEAYKTIEITGGDATKTEIIDFLWENATRLE